MMCLPVECVSNSLELFDLMRVKKLDFSCLTGTGNSLLALAANDHMGQLDKISGPNIRFFSAEHGIT